MTLRQTSLLMTNEASVLFFNQYIGLGPIN